MRKQAGMDLVFVMDCTLRARRPHHLRGNLARLREAVGDALPRDEFTGLRCFQVDMDGNGAVFLACARNRDLGQLGAAEAELETLRRAQLNR